MHARSIEPWKHRHVFLGASHTRNERRVWLVVALTGVAMVAEIAAGMIFGSMALLADGWHMSTHASALAIAALAYRYARRHAEDPRFSFGTGKLGELAAFASALLLAVVALAILAESATRLYAPVSIHYREAAAVAVIGLAVNLVSAWLLFDRGGHDHSHAHAHHHHHHDTNFRAAFLHVIADALTSVLAIVALTAGWFFGWSWLDPVIGLVGALVILRWSYQLLRSAGTVLLDMVPDGALEQALRRRLEVNGDRIADLHIWRVGPGHLAAIVSLVSDRPAPPSHYKALLRDIGLSHVTVEVHACEHKATA